MTSAINHDQHRSAGRPGGVTRSAAPRARHTCVDHHQFPARRSYLPRRANCRDRQDSPAFFFTPVSVDPDEIHELRICELTGRQAVLSRALLSTSGNGPATNTTERTDHDRA